MIEVYIYDVRLMQVLYMRHEQPRLLMLFFCIIAVCLKDAGIMY